ncbi:MAG: DUF167 domain-containing protein [Candidatus Tectomicrobia bacterium]|nr:DUF167 domain-containing protein [Candidatus Tectomicrobia bacterium]
MSPSEPKSSAAADAAASLRGWSCRDGEGGAAFTVKVQPRAARAALGQVQNGALTLRLTAAPVEGEANAACCKFLAKVLGVAAGRVHIRRGAGSRTKVIQVEGIEAAAVRARVAALLDRQSSARR